MANYKNVLPFTLLYEGGSKYCNIAEDAGGPTKWGISLTFVVQTEDMLFDMNGDGDLSADDIKLISEEVAIEGYKKYFWDNPYKLDSIESDKKAFLVFDASVNHGPGNATKMLQKALTRIGINCKADGKYGPKTKKAFQDAPVDKLVESYLIVREQFYKNIVSRRPNQKKFLKGWLNRIKWIRRDMEKLS